MVKILFKSLLRTIKNSLGRYIAILLIVLLGVGFFSGIKSSQPAMIKACDDLYSNGNMYDFQIQSTLGLTESDLESFNDQSFHYKGKADGGYNFQYIGKDSNSNKQKVFDTYSFSEKISTPILKFGKKIEANNECLADCEFYSESDIGKKITIDCKSLTSIDEARDENGVTKYTGLVSDFDLDLEDKSENVATFKIVGICQSPRFLSKERGATKLLDGNISSFLYIPKSRFFLYEHDPADKDFKIDSSTKAIDIPRNYTEILYSMGKKTSYFDSDYEKNISKFKNRITRKLNERIEVRFNSLYKQALDTKELLESILNTGIDDTYKKQIEDQLDEINKTLDEAPKGKGYVLSLNDANQGYINFKSQTDILSTVANIFPVFFIGIAALICVTTMKRMVSDERGEIATFKAIGYSNGFIISKYLIYSVSSALIGAFLGFNLLNLAIPQLAWLVFKSSYTIINFVPYYFSPVMYILCLAIAFVGIAIFTLIPCLSELRAKPSDGMRPKTPKVGKQMFIEKHMPKLWNKLSFMSKCIIRNLVRYKGRAAMFVLGISCCTMLIIMGLGFNDSISQIGEYQYSEIIKYDAQILLDDSEYELTDDDKNLLEEGCSDYYETFTGQEDFDCKGLTFSTNLICVNKDSYLKYFDFHSGKNKIDFPIDNSCIVTKNIAKHKNIKINDEIDMILDGQVLSLVVSGINDNFIDNYIFIQDSYLSNFQVNSLYVNLKSDITNKDDYYSKLRNIKGVLNITISSKMADTFLTTFNSISIVIVFIVMLSGVLTFLVLYNLTNINIIERTREIASIQVLGFHKNETAAYVLRENIVLSIFGSLLGLPIGLVIHSFIMQQISMPNMMFDIRINWYSFLLSFTITLVFSLIANFIMRFKLNKINMAESLKSVD